MKFASVICFFSCLLFSGMMVAQTQSSLSRADSVFSFTDSRDGRSYTAFRIRNYEWMGENLRFKTAKSFCYDTKDMGCKDFGRLYTWEEAVTACPPGWHLPNRAEWDSLIVWTGGDKKTGYALAYSDSLGFNMKFGYPPNQNGRYSGGNVQASYWSSDSYTSSTAWVYYFLKEKLPLSFTNYFSKNYGMSCRCVRPVDTTSSITD